MGHGKPGRSWNVLISFSMLGKSWRSNILSENKKAKGQKLKKMTD